MLYTANISKLRFPDKLSWRLFICTDVSFQIKWLTTNGEHKVINPWNVDVNKSCLIFNFTQGLFVWSFYLIRMQNSSLFQRWFWIGDGCQENSVPVEPSVDAWPTIFWFVSGEPRDQGVALVGTSCLLVYLESIWILCISGC